MCDKLGATHARASSDGRKSDEYSWDGREERERYAGIARSASYVTNQHPMFTRLLKHVNGGDSIVYGEWSIARRELRLCK